MRTSIPSVRQAGLASLYPRLAGFFRALPFLGFLSAFHSFSADTNSISPQTDLTQVPLEALMQIDVPTVSSASKFEQKITEAPASVSVVGSDEIKRYGYRTLADILESLQGFQVSNDRNYSFLGVRGISLGDFNSRV